MTPRILILKDEQVRRRAIEAVQQAPKDYRVTVAPPKRSNPANARMWAMLADISEQVDWYGRKLEPSDWKIIFTAAHRKLEVVPNLDGTGFVALGLHTSTMSSSEMSDLQELMSAFGAERGVEWSEPVRQAA